MSFIKRAAVTGVSFTTIQPDTGTSPVADSPNDTLTITGAGGITVSGNASNDTITITGTGSVPGLNTQIIFNDGGAFGAASDFTWNKTTKVHTIGGVISLSQPSTGALIIGNTAGNARGSNAINIQASRANVANVASGNGSIAIGNDTKASGANSIALGSGNTSSIASGPSSFAVQGGTASGSQSVAIGISAVASDYYALALGVSATATAFTSAAIGLYAQATELNAFALGYLAEAHEGDALAIGSRAQSWGSGATAIGYRVKNYEPFTVAFGTGEAGYSPQFVIRTNESDFYNNVNIVSGFGSEKFSPGSYLNFGTPVNYASSNVDGGGYTLLKEDNTFDFLIYGFKNYPGGPVFTTNYLSSGTINSGGCKPATSIDAIDSGAAPNIPDPTGATTGESGSGSAFLTGDQPQYEVYGYLVVNGTTYYSLLPSTTSTTVTTDGVNVDVSWDASGSNTDGYRVIRTLNSVQNSYDLAGSGSNFVSDDNSTVFVSTDLTITPHYPYGYMTTDVLDYAIYAYKSGEYQAIPTSQTGIYIANNGDKVDIYWSNSNPSNVDGYVILRTLNSVVSAHIIYNGYTQFFTDKNDYNDWQDSTTVTPTPSPFRIEMTWDALAGMDGYRVIIYDTQNGYNYDYYIDVATNALNYDGTATSPAPSAGSDHSPTDASTFDMSTWTLGACWTADPITQTIVKTGTGTGTIKQTSANMTTPLVVGEWYELTVNWTGGVGNLGITIAGVTLSDVSGTNIRQIFKAVSTADFVATSYYTSTGGVFTASLKKITDGQLRAFGAGYFGGDVDLSQHALKQTAFENLGTAPATPVTGQVYFDTGTNKLRCWDGSAWQNCW